MADYEGYVNIGGIELDGITWEDVQSMDLNYSQGYSWTSTNTTTNPIRKSPRSAQDVLNGFVIDNMYDEDGIVYATIKGANGAKFDIVISPRKE